MRPWLNHMGGFAGISGFNDDDQDLIGSRRRAGAPPSFVDFAAAGPQRPASDLPGIDVPSVKKEPEVAKATGATNATDVTKPKVSIAGPNASSDRLTQDQARLDELKKNGSPISRIHNPFLRGLAHVGDIAGSAFLPGYAALPFTNVKYRSNLRQAEHNVGQDLGEQKTQADIQHTQAETEHLNNPGSGTPEEQVFRDLLQQGKSPLEAFQTIKTIAQKPVNPGSPEEQTFNELVKQGVPRIEALKQVAGAKQEGKPDTAAQEDQRYERILTDKKLGKEIPPEDMAFLGAYEKRKTLGPVTTANLQAPGKASARSDKSYEKSSGKLDKMGEPITQAVARLGRLQDTLKQNTPQADALIAPELLTVMAGGAGSGLRMNEAEIARIVGGRSKWESLKASVNQWSLDPTKANSITDEQRLQIRSLVNEVHNKLLAKQRILDRANEQLLDTDDVAEHRRIVADAKNALSAIDEGHAAGGGGTIHYVDGTDEYDIPPAKEARFLEKHPNAQKQQQAQ